MKTKILTILLITVLAGCYTRSKAQPYFETSQKEWLKLAEENKPELVKEIKKPIHLAEIKKDETGFQGYKSVKTGSLNELYNYSFKDKKEVIVDFGEHLAGFFSFNIKAITGTPDAPVRFKCTFGEVPSELVTPFDPYVGTLSRAWLQDEIITVTEIPSKVTIQRRFAFRYVKIELLASSPYFDFSIYNLECETSTSAKNSVDKLPNGTDPLITEIDRIGMNTLKNCMQTIYEDGPKRDQRLWIGDLYLEALANAHSYKNHQLTKRSLYLLAAFCNDSGYLHANVIERPIPHPQQGTHILDYALLYNSALLEYTKTTNDLITATDLWPVALRQVEIAQEYLTDGMFDPEKAKEQWLFFDWNDKLDKQASMQGLMIFTFTQTLELAKMIDKTNDVANLGALVQNMKKTARKQLFDKKLGLVTSGPEKQISYSSQIWLALSGVLLKEEAKYVLIKVTSEENAIKPSTPYLYHFYIEALIKTGLNKEAKKALVNYWGGMVKKGADTFWEAYDPDNDFFSPYNFHPINSYCHAWSCTPVYFIRKYPTIFH